MVALALLSFGGAAIVSCEGGGSDETGTAGTGGGAGTTGAAGTTAAAGTGGGAGTSGAAGTSAAAGTGGGAGTTGAAGTGNATGTAGTTGGAGTGGAGTTGAAGTGGPSNGPYACTLFVGLLTTNEWYSKGFETAVYDGTKFELKYNHYGYVGAYADPNNPFWNTNITSPCTTNPNMPDRIVYAALDWEMLTKEAWVTALKKLVATIQLKYPSVKRIDLMSQIRCPMNKMCNPNANYGPGANMSAPRQDCYIPEYQDAAYAQVAAEMPNLVGLGPKTEATACRQPVDGTHLSDASNTQAAKDVAAYYSLPANR
jgi:hypothetical protein